MPTPTHLRPLRLAHLEALILLLEEELDAEGLLELYDDHPQRWPGEADADRWGAFCEALEEGSLGDVFGAATLEGLRAEGLRRALRSSAARVQALEVRLADLGADDPEAATFYRAMRHELEANASQGGAGSWKAAPLGFLMAETHGHAEKLARALSEDDPGRVLERAADVANLARMVYENWRALFDEDPVTSPPT